MLRGASFAMRIANRLAVACCTVILLLALVGQGGAAPLPTAPLPPEMAAYRPGAVLVRFRPGAGRLAQRRVLATLDAQPVRELVKLSLGQIKNIAEKLGVRL